MSRCRPGLTLFEVAASLLLLAISVSVMLALLPSAVRVQERVGFQQYASTRALDMIDAFVQQNLLLDDLDLTDVEPWESSAGRYGRQPTLENRIASMRGSLLAVPPAIAARIDSPDDLIRKIIADGGSVYYPTPYPSLNFGKDLQNSMRTPAEARRLIVGVLGYPQLDQIAEFPWKKVPQFVHWPSSPVALHPMSSDSDARTTHKMIEMQDDPALREVYWTWLTPPLTSPKSGDDVWASGGPVDDRTEWTLSNDSVSSIYPINDSTSGADDIATEAAGFRYYEGAGRHSRQMSYRLYALCRWYAARNGLSSPFLDGSALASEAQIDALLADSDRTMMARRVLAIRLLAAAAMTLTYLHNEAELTAGVNCRPPGGAGYTFRNAPPVDPAFRGQSVPGIDGVTLDQVRTQHENSLRVGMAYGARLPYDWGVFRPLNRAQMMDVPLLQWDLFSPPRAATAATALANGLANPAQQWLPLAAKDVTNIGASAVNPYAPIPSVTWGNRAHFTLCDRFSPSERCRQIVFWAVDWQSYEDFESAPAAPVDASRYPLIPSGVGYESHVDKYPTYASRTNTYAQSMGFNDTTQQLTRHPEKYLLFNADPASWIPGSSVIGKTVGDDFQQTVPDWKALPEDFSNPLVRTGAHGADRNNNLVYDRGPVKQHIRLRATEIVRFNYYDQRLNLLIR